MHPFFSINKFKSGFHNIFVVDCDGKSKGLALLWKDDVNCEVLNYYVNHIYGQVPIALDGVNQTQ